MAAAQSNDQPRPGNPDPRAVGDVVEDIERVENRVVSYAARRPRLERRSMNRTRPVSSPKTALGRTEFGTAPPPGGRAKGTMMLAKGVLSMAITGASAILVSSAVATANPATPMQKIESAAAQLCGTIDDRPTTDGVSAGMQDLANTGLDDVDGALVLITAVHHVCPQHERLIMDTLTELAAGEVCDKRW